MFYPKNKEESLSLELFKNPTSEYRGAPFWAWNCKLEKDELLRQIDVFKKMGFGGFHMHVRTGLETEYLSDEFMDYIKACVKKAKDNNMLSYLYDEDRWPSGAAGGIVTKENDEYRQRMLRITTVPYTSKKLGVVAGHEGSNARTEDGELITCFDIVLDQDGYLKSYNQIGFDDISDGTKWYVYLDKSPKTTWFNNQSYIDTLNKDAMDRFIEITYETYLKNCGKDFGKTIPSIFTDEPQFSHKRRIDYPTDKEDITLPWTPDLAKTFKETYGEDLIAGIPELFWNLPDGKVSTIRYHYHDHVAERFAIAFADNCGKWCREHGLMLTGHMMMEEDLHWQTTGVGETMRHYRGFDMPGIDMLCGAREFITAKQAQSAVHQFGREAMVSELYGVTGWDFDFRGHKVHGDWQAALGVTVRVPHLSWVSMKGEAKRDYPASISYQSSWYKEYSRVEDHFARVNTALTRGKPVAKVGVIHPVESYWLHFGVKSQTSAVLDEKNKNFLDLTDWLVKRTIDFDFISESLLPNLCEKGSAPLNVGKMEYDTIIVPNCETLRATTLTRLEGFLKDGGKLIFMGSAPTLIDAIPSKKGQKLYDKSIKVSYTCEALMGALEEERQVDIRFADGSIANRYCHQLRKDNDCLWLFVSQAIEPTKKDICYFDIVNIGIKGEYVPTLYDTNTGETKSIPCRYENGYTVITRDMYEYDSLLIKYEEGKADIKEVEKIDYNKELISTPYEVEFSLSEPNVCLLDLAEYSLDGEELRPEEEILKLDDILRGELGLNKRSDPVVQPWVLPKGKAKNSLYLRFTVLSEVAVSNVMLALEEPQNAVIKFNGKKVNNTSVGYYVDKDIVTVKLGKLKKGKNIIELTIPFGVNTNTEWCYLLGNFGVRVNGRKKVITKMPKTLCFGDVTSQGLAFYGGDIIYHLPVEFDGGRVEISTLHYKGGLVTVGTDNQKEGIIYPPYKAELTLPSGKSVIDVTLYGNRYNAFGHLHNADKEHRWIGPDCWHTEGSAWTYEYMLRPMGILSAPIVNKIK